MGSMRWAHVLLAAALLAVPASAEIVDRLDQPAPDLKCAKWWNDAPPKLKKLRGRVVVVHFSDPDQFTSRAFEGKLRELHEKHAERPFTLIEVALGETEADVASYVARNGATWHVGWDQDGAASRALPGSSVPRTYLVGPDGVVAFHAHLQALTPEILEAQFAWIAFFDTKTVPRNARKAATLAGELKFGKALEEAGKLLANKRSSDEERALAETIEREVARYYEFQMGVVEALRKELDWGVVQKRVARMRDIYKGTEHEKSVEEYWGKLEANPRVAYVAEAQRLLDRMLEKPQKKRNDVEALLRELTLFAGDYENTAPAEKAKHWIDELKRRLREWDAR